MNIHIPVFTIISLIYSSLKGFLPAVEMTFIPYINKVAMWGGYAAPHCNQNPKIQGSFRPQGEIYVMHSRSVGYSDF